MRKSILILALALLSTGCTTLEIGDAKLQSNFNKRSIGDLEYSTTDSNGVTRKLKMKAVQSDQVSGMLQMMQMGMQMGQAMATGGATLALPKPAPAPAPLVDPNDLFEIR